MTPRKRGIWRSGRTKRESNLWGDFKNIFFLKFYKPFLFQQKVAKSKIKENLYRGGGGYPFFGYELGRPRTHCRSLFPPAIILIVHQRGHIFCKPLDGLARLLHAPIERETATDRGNEKSLYTCRARA
jgi:hypothetical protein